MHLSFKFQPGQYVEYIGSTPAQIGRVSSQTDSGVFVKYEPYLTRHGWDECAPELTDLQDLVIITERTYVWALTQVVTPQDEMWWPDSPRDVRPPWERSTNEGFDGQR